MRLYVTPWQTFRIRTKSGTFRYYHCSLYNVGYEDFGPWLYARVFKRSRQKRWYYEVRLKFKTKYYPKRGCINGYTYSADKSISIASKFLESNKLRLLDEKKLQRFNLFSGLI